ncbi:MinD/ParA family ATP-binding protein [Parafrankia elaeagni]|uniref:MinD/ParA family ATP-binding protein n=1 Tax=Parafrankia elaeagni TaxID=222534 RepID=UPI001E49948A|nr:ParA family protein [Parafrankia elaeagni]
MPAGAPTEGYAAVPTGPTSPPPAVPAELAGPVTAPGPASDRLPVPAPAALPIARQDVARARRVLVGGFGGGGGRTTVAAGLGLALVARGQARVAAVDACPDQYGMLTQRVGLRARGSGVRELVTARPPVESLTDVRRYLSADGPGGLEVLGGVHDLAAPGLTGEELAAALGLLARWFRVVIADGPPGWSQPVPATLLARSDLVVLASRAGEADLAAADHALTALAAAGRADLQASAVLAVVETYPTRLTRAARQRLDDVAARVRHAVTVPFDPGLTDGRALAWQRLRRRTRAAFEELAAAVDPPDG